MHIQFCQKEKNGMTFKSIDISGVLATNFSSWKLKNINHIACLNVKCKNVKLISLFENF